MCLTSIRQYLKLTSVIALVSLMVACGFQMRGSYHVPMHLKNLCLEVNTEGPLAKQLRQRLTHTGVDLAESDVESSRNDCATLSLHSDELERRTLSLFPNGQVAEYQLIYMVKFDVSFIPPGKEEEQIRQFEFELFRDYQDDPNRVLAKSREMKLILSEMRNEAADRIVRLLSSIRY